MRIYSIVLIIFLLPVFVNSQDLTQEELERYSEDAQMKYNMYAKLIENMLNKNLGAQQRQDSRNLLEGLIDYKAKIHEPTLRKNSLMSKREFLDSLQAADLRYPLVKKEVIKKEPVVFKKGPIAVNQGEIQKWNVYGGKMRACEVMTFSGTVKEAKIPKTEIVLNKDNLRVKENYNLKLVEFELRKPEGDRPRKITIAKIETINKKNLEFIKCKKMEAAPNLKEERKDHDGDGFHEFVDCDDNDPNIHPDAKEIINGIDDDCDGNIDEDCEFVDNDEDGFPDEAYCKCNDKVTVLCDCDDLEKEIYPGREEVRNGKDDNCNGETDENLKYTPTQPIDFIVLGIGHMKYGKKNYVRWSTTILYAASFTTATYFAFRFKKREDDYYGKYKLATTYREQDDYYEKANNYHHKRLIANGSMLLIVGLNYAHLKIKDRRQRRILLGADRKDLIEQKEEKRERRKAERLIRKAEREERRKAKKGRTGLLAPPMEAPKRSIDFRFSVPHDPVVTGIGVTLNF